MMLLNVASPLFATALALVTTPATASADTSLASRSVPSALLLGQFATQPGQSLAGDLAVRQLTDNTIPSACRSVCGSTVKIYDACTGSSTAANRQTCLSVCEQNIFTEYTTCLQCAVDNVPGGFTTSELRLLQSAVTQLVDVCADEGKTVTSPSLTRAGSGTATQTGSTTSTSASSTRTVTTGSSTSASSASNTVPASDSAMALGTSPPAGTSQSGANKVYFPAASAGLAMVIVSLTTACIGLLAM